MSAIFYIPGNRLKFRLMPDSDIQTPSPRFTNLRIQLKILLWDNFLLKSSWKLSLQRYVKCFVKSAQILSNYNTFQASQSHSYMALSPRSRKEPGYEANSCIKERDWEVVTLCQYFTYTQLGHMHYSFSQNFNDVCLAHLFTYRDFQGKWTKSCCVKFYTIYFPTGCRYYWACICWRS